MILSKKETVLRKSSKKEFGTFLEKYEYYSNAMIGNMTDLANQFKTDITFSDTIEEKSSIIKKMKEDREVFKKKIAELKSETYTLLEKYNRYKDKLKTINYVAEKGPDSSPFSQQECLFLIQLKQITELNLILERKKKGIEKEIKTVYEKIKAEKEEKKLLMNGTKYLVCLAGNPKWSTRLKKLKILRKKLWKERSML